MPLKPVDIEKLERFLSKIAAETYPEPIGNLHAQITEGMLQKFTDKYVLPAAARVLDVGCGQGGFTAFHSQGVASDRYYP